MPSPLGLAVALAVLAPSLLMIGAASHGGERSARMPPLLVWLERAGQGLCVVVPVMTEPGPLRWGWSGLLAAALAGYYALWVRYLAAGRARAALYQALWRIPVPLAILPVVVFLAAAAWLSNPWIAASAAVLAAGHVPASVIVSRSILARRQAAPS